MPWGTKEGPPAVKPCAALGHKDHKGHKGHKDHAGHMGHMDCLEALRTLGGRCPAPTHSLADASSGASADPAAGPTPPGADGEGGDTEAGAKAGADGWRRFHSAVVALVPILAKATDHA